jgi:hypothetical protein
MGGLTCRDAPSGSSRPAANPWPMIIGPQSAARSMTLRSEDRPNEATTSPTATAGSRSWTVVCPLVPRRERGAPVYRPVANCTSTSTSTSTGPYGAGVEVMFLVDGM